VLFAHKRVIKPKGVTMKAGLHFRTIHILLTYHLLRTVVWLEERPGQPAASNVLNI